MDMLYKLSIIIIFMIIIMMNFSVKLSLNTFMVFKAVHSDGQCDKSVNLTYTKIKEFL